MCDKKKAFNVLLYDLAQRLKNEEGEAIIHIEDLPLKSGEKSPFQVLIQMQMLGKITELDPSKLENVMTNINRMDLVAKVTEFSKAQKKNKKTKSSGCNKGMESDLDANLKVVLLQITVLREQLINLANLVSRYNHPSACQLIQEAIRSLAQSVERTITCAKQELDGKYSSSSLESSSSEDDSSQLGLTRPLPLHQLDQKPGPTADFLKFQDVPYPTQEENKQNSNTADDENHYDVVTIAPLTPRIMVAAAASPDAEYCYAAPEPVPTNAPTTSTPVKMIADAKSKLKKVESYNSSLSSRGSPKNLRKPIPPPKPKPASPKPAAQQLYIQQSDDLDSSVDDCSYTGSTGDSGFVESWKYRRKPMPSPRLPSSSTVKGDMVKSRPTPAPKPPPKPNSYTKLNTEEVQLSYYKCIRDDHQRFQDVMSEDGTESHEVEEPLYQNYQ